MTESVQPRNFKKTSSLRNSFLYMPGFIFLDSWTFHLQVFTYPDLLTKLKASAGLNQKRLTLSSSGENLGISFSKVHVFHTFKMNDVRKMEIYGKLNILVLLENSVFVFTCCVRSSLGYFSYISFSSCSESIICLMYWLLSFTLTSQDPCL